MIYIYIYYNINCFIREADKATKTYTAGLSNEPKMMYSSPAVIHNFKCFMLVVR